MSEEIEAHRWLIAVPHDADLEMQALHAVLDCVLKHGLSRDQAERVAAYAMARVQAMPFDRVHGTLGGVQFGGSPSVGPTEEYQGGTP